MSLVDNLVKMFVGVGESLSLSPPRDYIVSSPKNDVENLNNDMGNISRDLVKVIDRTLKTDENKTP